MLLSTNITLQSFHVYNFTHVHIDYITRKQYDFGFGGQLRLEPFELERLAKILTLDKVLFV